MVVNLKVQKIEHKFDHLIKNFNSGNVYIDGFFKSEMAFNSFIGTTYVLMNDEATVIVGYYNICSGQLDEYIDENRVCIGPSVYINNLAVDKKFQKTVFFQDDSGIKIYYSDILLRDCINRVLNVITPNCGASFITLSSTTDGESLYLRNDFEYLEDNMVLSHSKTDFECKPMFLSLELLNEI